jgi:hypothetical protein
MVLVEWRKDIQIERLVECEINNVNVKSSNSNITIEIRMCMLDNKWHTLHSEY